MEIKYKVLWLAHHNPLLNITSQKAAFDIIHNLR